MIGKSSNSNSYIIIQLVTYRILKCNIMFFVTVTPDGNLDMAVETAVFSCVGTTGQRCTSTRRLILHSKIKDEFLGKIFLV